MEIVEIQKFHRDTGTVRGAKWKPELRGETPQNVFEVIAIDRYRFAALQLRVDRATIPAAAEVAENGDPERRVGLGPLEALSSLAGFNFHLGE
jgi:hypothetical protein